MNSLKSKPMDFALQRVSHTKEDSWKEASIKDTLCEITIVGVSL